MARLHGLRVGREPMSVQAVRNICVHPFLSACICVSPFLAGCRAARTEWRLAGGARFVVFESSWWTCWAASPVRPTGAHCRTRRAAPTGEPLSGGHGPYAEGVVEARNPIFVQRPYEPGGGPAGPGGPGWSGRGPEAPGRPGPGQTTRLVVVAGRRTRFSRVDAMQRGAGQQRRVGRVRARRRGWWLWRGTECDFRASMPCNVERASSAGLPGSGPDGTAGGCGGARNAIFARRCHATWSGPAAPGWPGPDRTTRLAGAAGHGMRFSRVDAMQRGAGQQRWLGRVRAGRARLPSAPGHGMRFSRVDAMQRGVGQQRRVGRVRTGRHGWRVPAGHEIRFPRVDAMQRGAGQRRRAVRVRTGWHGWRVPAGHGTRFSCKDPMNPAPAAMVGARASSIPALTRKLTPVLRSSASARMGPSAKGQGPPSANTMKSRACRRALAPVVGRCGWTGSNSHFGPSGCHIVMAVPGLVSGTAIHRGTVLWGWPEQVRP